MVDGDDGHDGKGDEHAGDGERDRGAAGAARLGQGHGQFSPIFSFTGDQHSRSGAAADDFFTKVRAWVGACFRAYDVNSLRYVRQRTESPAASAYNGSHREQDIRLTVMRRKTMSTRLSRTTLQLLGALAIAVAAVGCASDKTPATADVAVSRAAVDSATSSGAAELAPAELTSARDKMMKANQALAAKDYKAAKEWADLAAADAQLAQSKANTAKATSAANEVQQSVNAMRDELNRSNANQQQ